MPQATKQEKATPEGERSVISLPKEIVAAIDARIRTDGGDALANLGVEPATLRTGFVHKLLRESLDMTNGDAS